MLAAALESGDRFALPSGATYEVDEVHRLSHRTDIRTTVGEWLTLFPRVRVTLI